MKPVAWTYQNYLDERAVKMRTAALVKKGRLTRKPCSVCSKSMAYLFPYDDNGTVRPRWFCLVCFRKDEANTGRMKEREGISGIKCPDCETAFISVQEREDPTPTCFYCERAHDAMDAAREYMAMELGPKGTCEICGKQNPNIFLDNYLEPHVIRLLCTPCRRTIYRSRGSWPL